MDYEKYFIADFEKGVLYSNPARPRETFKSDRAYKTWKSRNAGKIIGGKTQINSRNKTRYYTWVCDSGKSHFLHRVIWEMHNKRPIREGFEIDHIDGNGLNNSISNLREVTRKENARNVGLISTNKTGVKGVSFQQRYSKYLVCISVNGKNKTIGRFDNLNKALEARIAAEKKYWGVCYGVA